MATLQHNRPESKREMLLCGLPRRLTGLHGFELPVCFDSLPFTRQQDMPHAGFQAPVETRRSLQAVVAPLAKAAMPNQLTIKGRPSCAGLLQGGKTALESPSGKFCRRRRQTGARRLNTIHVFTGLITDSSVTQSRGKQLLDMNNRADRNNAR